MRQKYGQIFAVFIISAWFFIKLVLTTLKENSLKVFMFILCDNKKYRKQI